MALRMSDQLKEEQQNENKTDGLVSSVSADNKPLYSEGQIISFIKDCIIQLQTAIISESVKPLKNFRNRSYPKITHIREK